MTFRSEEYQQVMLSSHPPDDNWLWMICWVDRRVKEGDSITLKDYKEPERRWTVEETYGNVQPSHQRRVWRVGGLK